MNTITIDNNLYSEAILYAEKKTNEHCWAF